MGLSFSLMIQLINETDMRIDFRIPVNNEDPDGPARYLPELPALQPRTTGMLKPDIILKRCFNRVSAAWKIHVYVDGRFSGTKVLARVLLEHVRIVFVYMNNQNGDPVLCVNGVKEKRIDMLYGRRFIGSMLKRDSRWNRRRIIRIYPEDSVEVEDKDPGSDDRHREAEDLCLLASASPDVMSKRRFLASGYEDKLDS